MVLEGIILSKRCLKEKNEYEITSFMDKIKKKKKTEKEDTNKTCLTYCPKAKDSGKEEKGEE